jgi:hypothetical protein
VKRKLVLTFLDDLDHAMVLVALAKTEARGFEEPSELDGSKIALWARERLDRRHVEPSNGLDSIEFTPKPAGKEKA